MGIDLAADKFPPGTDTVPRLERGEPPELGAEERRTGSMLEFAFGPQSKQYVATSYPRKSTAGSLATVDEDSPWAQKTILSFDGGGIRGYSSLLLLQQLMKEIQACERSFEPRTMASTESPLIEPDRAKAKLAKFPTQTGGHSKFLLCHYFDYIAGTSTGGLIAIMLGRLRMGVDDALGTYLELYKQIFPRPGYFHLPGLVRSRRNSSSFKEKIHNLRPAQSSPEETDTYFSSDVGRCRTIVCSVQSGDKGFQVPYLYRSYPAQSKWKADIHDDTDRAVDLSVVMRATSAAPTLFKTASLSANLNNPSFEIYKEVERQHDRFMDPISVFLSLGSGDPKHTSSQTRKQGSKRNNVAPSKLEKHLSQVSDAVHEIMLEESDDGDIFSYYRLDVKDRLSTVRIDEWKPFKSGEDTLNQIKSATSAYLKDPRVDEMIKKCATELVEKRRRRCQTMRWESFALGTRYRCMVDPPCDRKDSRGKPFTYRNRNELMDHLRSYHGKQPPDAENYQEIKTLLDKGRTDSDLSSAPSHDTI